MADGLAFEDFFVGQKFSTGSFLVTSEDIKAFAAKFDPQPFHVDEDAAKDSFFGGLAASGWHTAAISMHLNVTSGPAIAKGMIGGGGEISWPIPTRPGDVLRVHSEVIEKTASRSRSDRGTVLLRSETVNQDGKIVQLATMKLLVFRAEVSA